MTVSLYRRRTGNGGAGASCLSRRSGIEDRKALYRLGAGRSIGDVEVTCVDAAMPVMIARAADFGKTGYESVSELNADKGFLKSWKTCVSRRGSAWEFPMRPIASSPSRC